MTTAAATRSWEAAEVYNPLSPSVWMLLQFRKWNPPAYFPSTKCRATGIKRGGGTKKRIGTLPFPTSLRGALSGRRAQQHRRSSAAGLEDGGTAPKSRPRSSRPARDRVCELASSPSRPGAVRREYPLCPVPHKPRGHETRTPAASASLPV